MGDKRNDDLAGSGSPGLSFYLPEVSRKHTVLHIPGSHTLYVGPLSCTRRHDIHARQYGERKDVSFLFISQADVVSGRYEDLMVESVGELLELLDPAPRIFQLAVFCIDDFLGTDETALLERLRRAYPQCQFAIDHIDPVSLNERMNMASNLLSTQYSFILPRAPHEHDNGVNLLGTFVPFDPDCDLLHMLAGWGLGPLRALHACETYEDYQAMGASRLALVFRLMNTASADFMRDRLGIPYIVATPSYDAQAVAHLYCDIARELGEPEPDLSAQVEACREDAQRTARLLDGLPVAIDCEFSLMVFAAAKALLGYGFNVRCIFRSNHRFKLDAQAESFILEQCPQVLVTRAESHTHLYESALGSDCLALGVDCARLLDARYVVDIWHDEGYFGFQGIHKLMAAIRAAVGKEG
ncbi:MAG: hypothetical protein IJH83_00835 [Coriobacteriales bacterium]|nr:hypothetical protein [Coriobacteriales bacterium]